MLQCVQSKGPSQPQDPFSDTGRARGQGEEGVGVVVVVGFPGPPYAIASVQRGGYHLQHSLRRITLFNHEVVDENTLSNNRCTGGHNMVLSSDFHLLLVIIIRSPLSLWI